MARVKATKNAPKDSSATKQCAKPNSGNVCELAAIILYAKMAGPALLPSVETDSVEHNAETMELALKA